MVPTDIKQNSAVKPLIYDMVLKDLVVESLRTSFSSRHFCVKYSLKEQKIRKSTYSIDLLEMVGDNEEEGGGEGGRGVV